MSRSEDSFSGLDPKARSAFFKNSRFQLEIWAGCISNLAARSGRLVCSLIASIATLALKDALNFLLGIFILTGLNYNLISCPIFGEYYTSPVLNCFRNSSFNNSSFLLYVNNKIKPKNSWGMLQLFSIYTLYEIVLFKSLNKYAIGILQY